MTSPSPFTPARLRELAERYGTPLYIYDAELLRQQVRSLARFDVVRFAQKALPNLHVQRLMRAEGAFVDCVSAGELERALRAGFDPRSQEMEIVYTADVLTPATIDRIVETGVAVNAGSVDMLSQLGERSPGHRVWLRVNPGFGHGHSRKVNTGGESSKHGIWSDDIPDALRRIDRHGLSLVGLHMHIGSGADITHLKRVCEAMIAQVAELGRDVVAISGGGGLSIPYKEGDPRVNVDEYFRCWDDARKRIEDRLGHRVQLEIEPGRYLTAQAGVLLSEVRATKRMGGNHFTLVDAGFNDLVRPAMYGAYHRISLIPRESAPGTEQPTVVAGPLCESGDVFTQDAGGEVQARALPPARVGDLLVFHDAGAYGASMGSNYNSRGLPAEVLLDGAEARLIRRRQTIDDLLALEELT